MPSRDSLQQLRDAVTAAPRALPAAASTNGPAPTAVEVIDLTSNAVSRIPRWVRHGLIAIVATQTVILALLIIGGPELFFRICRAPATAWSMVYELGGLATVPLIICTGSLLWSIGALAAHQRHLWRRC